MVAVHWSDSRIKGCPRVYPCCSENGFWKIDFKSLNSHRQLSCLENKKSLVRDEAGEAGEGKTALLGHEAVPI